MMEFNFNKSEILSAIQNRAHHIDGVSYTYDKDFDILRIQFKKNKDGRIKDFYEPDNNGYIFFINDKGTSKGEVEIQSFLKNYQYNLYSKYLNKKELNIIQDIREKLVNN